MAKLKSENAQLRQELKTKNEVAAAVKAQTARTLAEIKESQGFVVRQTKKLKNLRQMNKYRPKVVIAVVVGRTLLIRMIYLMTALGKRGVRETSGLKIIFILKTALVGKDGPAGRWDQLLRPISLLTPIWNQYKR